MFFGQFLWYNPFIKITRNGAMIMTKKLTAWILIATILMSFFTLQITGFAEESVDLDLSTLSETDENTEESNETYFYTWTVEEIDGETVRSLELTLDGADIKTLTLPCKSYGKIHVTINTVSDSKIEEICESHVFSYSYQWDTITFKGEGNLQIDSANLQGGGNDHMITVSKGACVEISGEYASLGFGASGNSNSSLNVDGILSVNGNVHCGNVKIGEEGHLTCKRVIASGIGASDTDEYANAFVIEDGGKLDARGDDNWVDDASGESYSALVVCARLESDDASTVIVLPDGYLSSGFTVVKTDNYVTIDNGDEKAVEETGFEAGLIYGASSLVLGTVQEKYTIIFENEDGTELQRIDLEAGETPVYTGETPTKPADADYTYTFVGWTPDIEEVTESKTYTAFFDAIPIITTVHTVAFDSKGGSGVEDVTVADGEMLEKPVNPTKSGYRFKGWFTDAELDEKYDFDTPVTSSFTLYAKWQKKQSPGGGNSGNITISTNVNNYHIVKFEPNNGSEPTEIKVVRYAQLEKPENPLKEGYVFGGWYTEKELKSPYNFDNVVTESMTLFARWTEAEKYSENEDDNNGNVDSGHVCYSLKFDDLDITKWYHYDTDYVIGKNIFRGISETMFAPHGNITRAMMITVLYRIEGEPEVAGTTTFEDVDMDAYYADAVIWGQQNGIIKGYSETEFAPEADILREQIAAIMHRFAEYKGIDVSVGENTNILSYDDFDEISEYAIHSMCWAVGAEVIKGKTETTLNPQDYAERVEIAAILHRFILTSM